MLTNTLSIVSAIFIIEGGTNTHYPYGIKSIKTSNPKQICINTVNNNCKRFEKEHGIVLYDGRNEKFLDYLANRYCPPKSDKTGNKNWKKNIRKALKIK